MKRLCGGREVEKIVFGKELFYMRRRALCALVCVIAFVALGFLLAMVFIPRGDGGVSSSPHLTNPDVENIASGNNGDKESAGDVDAGGENEEESSENESEEPNNPIIYKDFSTPYLNIVNNTVFDVSFLNSTPVGISKYYDSESRKPIVLVLHTYTSDRYADSDGKYGVCAAGQVLADELNSMGIGAVYSSAVHDGDTNDPAENARETIEFYLKMYPSIKYVFDVGIMQEYEGDKIIATQGEYMGQRAAQIRLLVAGNNISSNRDNLYLAAEINKNLSRGDMNLAREIVYDDSIGNSMLTPYYLEIFIGSSGNTQREAEISARVLANAFGQFLS